MRRIFLRNKGNFESVATPTVEKFPEVYRENPSCPFGLLAKIVARGGEGLER